MNLESKLSHVEWGRLQYSSSWDRGLDNILFLLPWIKEKCPDLTLHVYYGISGWIESARSRNDTDALRLIEKIQKQIESMRDYVFIYNRVNQKELSLEWRKAWCWLYMTQFTETYCITAKEAQSSATPIVCSDIGALKTTVGNHGMQIPFPYSSQGRQAAIDDVVKMYHDRDYWIRRAEQSLGGSRDCDWDSVYANYWSKFL